MFEHHAYTDGLSAIPPAPRPTSRPRAGPAGPPPTSGSSRRWTPNSVPPPALVSGTGAGPALRGLGLPRTAGDLLQAVPGADGRPQEAEAGLADVLWESTLGSFLSDVLRPVVPDRQNGWLRDHVREHLFPGGPFTALRVSRQPYGVLPVVARGFEPDPADPVEADLLGILEKLRIFWEQAVPRVPRLGRTPDLDADLDELLQTTPLAAAVRFRTVLGPLTVSLDGRAGPARRGAAVHQQHARVHLGVPPPTPWNEFALHPGHQPLDRPFVADATAARLAEVAGAGSDQRHLRGTQGPEDEVVTLLEAMALYAAGTGAAPRGYGHHQRFSSHLRPARRAAGARRAAVGRVRRDRGLRPVPPGSVRVTTPADASRVVIPGVTGPRTVRAFVTDRLAEVGPPAEVATLQRVLAALDGLSSCPPDELDRALRGLLDVYSHRLDAWYTSLATRRLAAVRATTPDGVHLGGYGWLDDLRPPPTPR